MIARPASLVALLLLAVPSGAGSTLLQPLSGERGLQVALDGGRAWLLRANGQRLRLPLRRSETIEELVEFDGGWAATGSRIAGDRRELVVVIDGAAGVERLRNVPEPIGALRVKPVPMASAGAFEGLAWLEGDSPESYEVRVAEWDGAAWSPPVTVSPARRGGQAGLVGTVLEDGRWLLVWSAFDGTDSDLYWSLGDGGGWTTPKRLAPDNRVPDVTPSLVRTSGGALVVWAQPDGTNYRLRAARFAEGWAKPRRIGPDHASNPRFAELAGVGRFLVHRAGGAWSAVEVDASGRELRRAEIAGERSERPVLTAAGGGIGLRWEARERARPLQWEASP